MAAPSPGKYRVRTSATDVSRTSDSSPDILGRSITNASVMMGSSPLKSRASKPLTNISTTNASASGSPTKQQQTIIFSTPTKMRGSNTAYQPSPLRIKVTLETEPEPEEEPQNQYKSKTTTVKVPLKGDDTLRKPLKRRRTSDAPTTDDDTLAGAATGKRRATPARKNLGRTRTSMDASSAGNTPIMKHTTEQDGGVADASEQPTEAKARSRRKSAGAKASSTTPTTPEEAPERSVDVDSGLGHGSSRHEVQPSPLPSQIMSGKKSPRASSATAQSRVYTPRRLDGFDDSLLSSRPLSSVPGTSQRSPSHVRSDPVDELTEVSDDDDQSGLDEDGETARLDRSLAESEGFTMVSIASLRSQREEAEREGTAHGGEYDSQHGPPEGFHVHQRSPPLRRHSQTPRSSAKRAQAHIRTTASPLDPSATLGEASVHSAVKASEVLQRTILNSNEDNVAAKVTASSLRGHTRSIVRSDPFEAFRTGTRRTLRAGLAMGELLAQSEPGMHDVRQEIDGQERSLPPHARPAILRDEGFARLPTPADTADDSSSPHGTVDASHMSAPSKMAELQESRKKHYDDMSWEPTTFIEERAAAEQAQHPPVHPDVNGETIPVQANSPAEPQQTPRSASLLAVARITKVPPKRAKGWVYLDDDGNPIEEPTSATLPAPPLPGTGSRRSYDEMSWEPTGPPSKSADARPSSKPATGGGADEQEPTTQATAAPADVQARQSTAARSRGSQPRRHGPQGGDGSGGGDIWLEEANSILEDSLAEQAGRKKKKSDRASTALEPDQDDNTPDLNHIFGPPDTRPTRGRLPRTWRRTSGNHFLYSDENSSPVSKKKNRPKSLFLQDLGALNEGDFEVVLDQEAIVAPQQTLQVMRSIERSPSPLKGILSSPVRPRISPHSREVRFGKDQIQEFADESIEDVSTDAEDSAAGSDQSEASCDADATVYSNDTSATDGSTEAQTSDVRQLRQELKAATPKTNQRTDLKRSADHAGLDAESGRLDKKGSAAIRPDPKRQYPKLFDTNTRTSTTKVPTNAPAAEPLTPRRKPLPSTPRRPPPPSKSTNQAVRGIFSRITSWLYPPEPAQFTSPTASKSQLATKSTIAKPPASTGWNRNHYLLLEPHWKAAFPTPANVLEAVIALHGTTSSTEPSATSAAVPELFYSELSADLKKHIGTLISAPGEHAMQTTRSHCLVAQNFMRETSERGVPLLCNGSVDEDDAKAAGEEGVWPKRDNNGRVVREKQDWKAWEVLKRIYGLWVRDVDLGVEEGRRKGDERVVSIAWPVV